MSLDKVELDTNAAKWIEVSVPEGATIVVFDPFIIETKDLQNMEAGKISLVRIRRPGWGRGNIKEFIHVI